MAALVSVIIANHNGVAFLERCLRSLLASSYPELEVIFVDNASSDGSLEFVRATFGSDSRLRYVVNDQSVGPGVGRNRGARVARGTYLMFLDNDTEVERRCIAELVAVFEADASIGAGQAKLLQMDNPSFYDCAGDYLGPLGFLIERAKRQKDTGQFNFIADILSAKGAAHFIRKALFERLGGFDEDYYMYVEETDLCWRVWLSGQRVVFIPSAIVYHAFESPKKQFKKYYSRYVVRFCGCRNYLLTLIKNMDAPDLARMLFLHTMVWVAMALSFLARGKFQDAFYIVKALAWHPLHLGVSLRKRRYVQHKLRSALVRQLPRHLRAGEGIDEYLRKAFKYVTYR